MTPNGKSITLIAAVSLNKAIGKNGKMPWHSPVDLQFFRHITTSKPVIMGRTTYESIGKPLDMRQNFIVTSDENYDLNLSEKANPHNVSVCTSLEEAVLQADEQSFSEEVMIIGGSNVYKQMIDYADRLYLTRILLWVEGDTFFPELDEADWMQDTLFTLQHETGNEADPHYNPPLMIEQWEATKMTVFPNQDNDDTMGESSTGTDG